MSKEYLPEIGVGESNGDIISGLGRHLERILQFRKLHEFCYR
jgi:hypothetical protein